MAKSRPKLSIVTYYLKSWTAAEAFARLWEQLAKAPFQAQKFDSVELLG